MSARGTTLRTLMRMAFPRISTILLFTAGLLAGAASPALAQEEVHQSGPLFVEFAGLHGLQVRDYNRVDGPALALGFTAGGIEEILIPRLKAELISHTGRGRWGWDLLATSTLFDLRRLTLGGRFLLHTDTPDRWRMTDLENSLALFLLGEDFRSYYERRGVGLLAEQEIDPYWHLAVEYAREEHNSLRARDPFSLFGRDKTVRENPPAQDGQLRALTVALTHDSRDNIRYPRTGWYTTARWERAGGALGGDLTFTRWEVIARRYNRLGGRQHLDLRVMAAGSPDSLPPQRLYTLGGVGTLRGSPDLSRSGDRLFLANVEYRFPLPSLTWRPAVLLFNELSGLLFLDVGDAWSPRPWPPRRATSRDLRLDIGAGLSGANLLSYFGLYVGQNLNAGHKGPRVTVKIVRDF